MLSMKRNTSSELVLRVGIIWFFLAVVLSLLINVKSEASHNILTITCFLSYILSFWTWLKTGGNMASLYTVFILYAMFSNLGQSILYLFNLSELLSIYYVYNLSEISEMLRFQLLCIAALNVGSALYIYNNRQINIFDVKIQKRENTKSKSSFLEVLLLISIVWMIVYSLYQLRLRQTVDYSDIVETRDPVSKIPYFLSVVLSFYFLFQGKYIRLSIISFIWLLFAFFLAGTRSMGIVYAGALVIMALLVKPELFKGKKVLIWMVVAIPAFALISAISDFRTSTLGNAEISLESGVFYGALGTISEMGLSERPAIATIEFIKNGGAHVQTILYTVLHGLIPTAPLQLIMPAGSDISLSAWVTEYENHEYSGLGYSFIAEAYMNYGIWGWIFTLLYGYLITGLEITSYKKINEGKYLFPAVVLTVLSKQIFFARANLLLIHTYYRYALYIWIGWLIYKSMNKKQYAL